MPRHELKASEEIVVDIYECCFIATLGAVGNMRFFLLHASMEQICAAQCFCCEMFNIHGNEHIPIIIVQFHVPEQMGLIWRRPESRGQLGQTVERQDYTKPSPLYLHSSRGAAPLGCWARRHLEQW